MQKYFSLVTIAIIGLIILLSNGDRNIANCATMHTRKQVLEIIHRQAKAWENADIEAIGADFADDAVLVVGKNVFNGKQEIKAIAQDYFNQFSDTQITIKRSIIDIENQRAAVEWDWQDKNRQNEELSYAEDAIILELKNNKITYWREYIEKQ